MDEELRVFRASRPAGWTVLTLFGIALVSFGAIYFFWGLNLFTFLLPAPFLVLALMRGWGKAFPNRDRIEVDSAGIRSIVGIRKTEIRWPDVAAYGWLEEYEDVYPMVRARNGRAIYLWADVGYDELIEVIAKHTGLKFTERIDLGY